MRVMFRDVWITTEKEKLSRLHSHKKLTKIVTESRKEAHINMFNHRRMYHTLSEDHRVEHCAQALHNVGRKQHIHLFLQVAFRVLLADIADRKLLGRHGVFLLHSLCMWAVSRNTILNIMFKETKIQKRCMTCWNAQGTIIPCCTTSPRLAFLKQPSHCGSRAP